MKMALVVPILALALAGCGEKTASENGGVQRGEIAGITVLEVSREPVTDIYEAPGTIKAATVSEVSSRAMGKVASINVREGDTVRKGQVLLTIEDSDTSQREAAARAGLGEAEKGLQAARERMKLADAAYRRYGALHEAKAVSLHEFETVSMQRETAKLEYERMEEAVNRARALSREAEITRGFAKVASPLDGVVSKKMIDEGSMALPGVPLLVVEDTSAFVIEAPIIERLAGKIRPGDAARAKVDSLEGEYDAVITEVMPSLDPLTRTFNVKASVKGDGLRTGLFARLLVATGEREALAVPKGAIVSKGQLTGVYVVGEDGTALYRLVRLGRPVGGGSVEAVSGLWPGERVITGGTERAFDGGIVKENK
ncbi:MAG: efflux RND transporter periplasmic adaptor subunit [Deltaproteobacteria bacterium]|nr:efflux RND transporter periplasmic adaptor subunit [Deltaproteobacteria bacterium]MBZ0219805.1 efflux RND transporter periplasmic adaptor subunit [Deltaproteobacteria bacterium]